jgi:hypothetical protein
MAGALTDAVVRQVETALARQDFDGALHSIKDTMLRAFAVSRRRDLLNLGSPVIDDLCLRTGARIHETLAPDPPHSMTSPGRSPSPDVYLASELYDEGGHTAVIGDFIRATPARHAWVLVTDIENRSVIGEHVLARVGVPRLNVLVNPRRDLVGKLAWLMRTLDRLAPERVFLFNHPHDCVAVAACQPRPRTAFVFVHHTDRNPSLGAFLPSAVHADLTPFCFACCRTKAGIADNVFIPIVTPDRGCRNFSRPRADFNDLVTASSGSPHKYRPDYRPSYGAVIAEVLRLTGGQHVHIGPMRGRDLRALRSAMQRAGVSGDKLVHVPHVDSVWDAMSTFAVDLYIGSFPVRGARTSVEVMGSGTPAIWHVAGEPTIFHDTHMKYPEAATWQTMDDLLALVRQIDGEWFGRQARAARRHYDMHHRPELIAEQLAPRRPPPRTPPAIGADWAEPRLVPFDALEARDSSRLARLMRQAGSRYPRLRRSLLSVAGRAWRGAWPR